MAGSKSQSTVCQHCGGPIPKGGRPNRKFCKPSCRTLAYRARQLNAQQTTAPPERAAAPPERAAAPPSIPDALHPEVVASLSRVRELEATVDRMVGQCTELTRELASSAAQLSEANHQRARLEEELKRQQREHAEQLQKLQPPASPPKPQIGAAEAAPAPRSVTAPVAVVEAAPARSTAVQQEPATPTPPAVPPGATVAPAPAAPAAPPGVTAAAPASAAPRRLFSAGLCSLRGIVAPAVLPPPRPGVLSRVQALFRRAPSDPTRPMPRR